MSMQIGLLKWFFFFPKKVIWYIGESSWDNAGRVPEDHDGRKGLILLLLKVQECRGAEGWEEANHHFPERLVQFISSEDPLHAYSLYPRAIPSKLASHRSHPVVLTHQDHISICDNFPSTQRTSFRISYRVSMLVMNSPSFFFFFGGVSISLIFKEWFYWV